MPRPRLPLSHGLWLALLGVSLAGCSVFGGSSGDAEAVEDTVVPVERRDLSLTITSAGNATIAEKASLRFGVAGVIEEVLVEKGDAVGQGQELARLETSALRLAVLQAEAKVASAEDTLAQLMAGASELELAQAKADIASAQDALDDLLEPPSALDTDLAAEAVAQARETLANAQAEEATTEIAQATVVDDAQRAYDQEADEYRFLFRNHYGIRVLDDDILASPTAILATYPADDQVVQYWRTLFPFGLDPSAVETALDDAWRSVEQAHSSMESGKVQRAKALTSAAKAVTQATAGLQAAEESLERLASGPDPVVVEQKRLAVERAREALETLLEGPDPVLLQLKGVDLEAAAESLREAQDKLAKALLLAPMNGVITSVTMDPGDTVGASTVIVAMADPVSMEVAGLVDEIDLLSVREGQTTRVSLSAFPALEVPGTVQAIDLLPTAQGGVVSYGVTIGIAGRGATLLRDGMTVTATIVVEERKDVLAIPVGAVQRQEREQVVQVVGDDGQRETRSVTLGLSDGLWVEVREGLSEGERVVVPTSTAVQSSFLGRQGFGGFGAGGGIFPPGGGGFRGRPDER